LLIVDFNTALVAGTGQATREEERAVERVLAASPHVMHLTFVSRQAALAAMKRAEPRLAAALPFNPLPDEYRVTVQKADAQQLERQLVSLPGVQKVILGRITRR
jgi:cell division protein FtsX